MTAHRHTPAEYGIIQPEPGITLCGRPANGDNIDSMDDLPTATCRTCQKAWVGC